MLWGQSTHCERQESREVISLDTPSPPVSSEAWSYSECSSSNNASSTLPQKTKEGSCPTSGPLSFPNHFVASPKKSVCCGSVGSDSSESTPVAGEWYARRSIAVDPISECTSRGTNGVPVWSPSTRQEEEDYQQALQLYQQEEEERLKMEEADAKLARELYMEDEQQLQAQTHSEDNQGLSCSKCCKQHDLGSLIFCDACPHIYCRCCLRNMLLSTPGKVDNKCSIDGCDSEISESNMRDALSPKEFEDFERGQLQQFFQSQGCNFVTCPRESCRCVFERILQEFNPNHQRPQLDKERTWTAETLRHRFENRFRCPSCSSIFCAQCKRVPYHNGYTCEKFEEIHNAKQCRFCREPLNEGNIAKRPLHLPESFGDVCTDEECLKRRNNSCSNTLPCGHPCCGHVNEASCPRCLFCPASNPSTQVHDAHGAQSANDFCAICGVEELSCAPCIMLECGHIFHQHCAVAKVEKGPPGSRITFGFLGCALCKRRMKHPSLAATLNPYEELYSKVSEMAVQRLQLLKQTDVQELSEPSSRFYQNPTAYALYRFSYYTCYKCGVSLHSNYSWNSVFMFTLQRRS